MEKKMKTKPTLVILLILLLFLPVSFAFADEASHKAAAEELMLLSNMDQMSDQIWAQVRDMVDQQFQQMGAPEELRPVFKKYMDRMFEVLATEMDPKGMKDDIVAIYVQTYTESEIRAISDFYKSPAGQAFLAKTPQLMQNSMAIYKKKLPPLMEKIKAISEEMTRELECMKKQQQQKESD